MNMIPDNSYNEELDHGPDLKDELEMISNLLLPGKARISASEEFWRAGGQSILKAVALDLAARYENFDLPMLRRRLHSPRDIGSR